MLIAVLLALSQGEPEPRQDQEDRRTLERRVDDLRKKRAELDHRIDDALNRGDGEAAVKAREEQKKVDQDLGEARGKLDVLQRPGKLTWGVEAILTHWDNNLDLSDRAGWSAHISGIPGLFFEYARWETRDEDGADDALIQAYRLGIEGVAEASADFTLGIMLSGGLVRFGSDAAGADGDTGLIATIHPKAVWTLRPGLRFSAGMEIDIVRTDFNQEHTHTNHNVSGTFGLQFGW